MKIEIEAKLRLADRVDIQSRLKKLSAQPVADMREVNIFLDSPENRLKATDRGLRVRLVNINGKQTQVTITFKGPRSVGPLKSRREIEIDVDSAEAALNLLAELGYHEAIRFEKRRKRYMLDGCTIELDEMPYLGHFLEIEGPDDATILKVREKLGLSSQPLIHSSYVAMLSSYLSDHGITERNIVFAEAAKTKA